jgi:SPP1 family predicted phage head-tail adaptor
MTTINQKRTRVTLQAPGPAVPDGAGGFTEAWADLAPAQAQASITPATARHLERIPAGTTMATATHLLTIWYRPDVTTRTRVFIPPGRLLSVVSVSDPTNEQRELELVCTEVVP